MFVRYLTIGLVLGACLRMGLPVTASGDDWPTYRYDASRSGFSPHALPGELERHWRRQLPQYEVAFPHEPRKQFDASHQPVYAAGVVVVACPADGSVRAYAAATGEELWRYYAEAPVRLAPVLHEGRVLFGADDGRFRCLDLESGELLWEHRAFLEEAPDVRLLGNHRLISHWPVRGGPVVWDETVYFGSGVWPTMGVFVWALDVGTGEPRWVHSGLGHIRGVRIDHDVRHDSGISPQGYLLATEQRLVVPSGRSHPLGLNRGDGSLFHWVMGYRSGDWRVVSGGDYLLVGERGVLSQADFREVGNTFQAAGTADPDEVEARRDLTESPRQPYKLFRGADANSIIDGSLAYSLVDGVFLIHDLAQSGVAEHGESPLQAVSHVFRWDARMTHRAPTGLSGDTRLLARAGDTFYGRAGTRLVALRLTGETPAAEVVWEVEVEARPTSVIAGGGRLFAALEDGTLLGFGAGVGPDFQPPEPEPRVIHAAEPEELAADGDPPSGFVIALGGLSAEETEWFLRETPARLIVVAEDAEPQARERRRLALAGQYGRRVERFRGDPWQFRLPHYLASLLWCRGEVLGVPEEAELQRLWDAVRPYGGRLRYTGSEEQNRQFAVRAAAAGLAGVEIASDARGVTLNRPAGPEGSADWTHETADAARSFFSRDTAVRAPLAPLWFGDGPDYGFVKRKDYGIGVKPQVVQGRVFALQQHTRTLVAYDAYTGCVLWRARGEGEDAGFITRHAVLPDGVYAAGRGLCVVYDPASGEQQRRIEYAAGEDQPARAAGIVVTADSILIAASQFPEVRAIEHGLWDFEELICLDRTTGEERWRRSAAERFNIKALAASDGRVYVTDSLSPLAIGRWQRRGEDLQESSSRILALDESTGRERWSHEYTADYRQHGASGWTTVRGTDDWLSYVKESGRLLAGRAGHTTLLDGGSGQPVWARAMSLVQPVVILGDRFVDQRARMFEIASGEQLESGLFDRGGCNYAVANRYLTFLRGWTVSYADLETGEQHFLRNMRSGCSNSLVAASGVLSMPQYSELCVCNYPLQTTSAWIHLPEAPEWAPPETVALEPPPIHILPRLTPDEARAMHAFARRFLVEDPEDAEAHLRAHWDFAGLEDGASAAADRSGRGVECRLTHARFTTGPGGQALLCDGQQAPAVGRARLGASDPIRDAVTLAAWVRIGETQPYARGNSGIVESPQRYRLMVYETEPPYSIRFDVLAEDGSWRSAGSPQGQIPAEQWVHVAGTYDSETGETVFYLNGEPTTRSNHRPGRIQPSGEELVVGLRDGVAHLHGAVADVRVYDRVLGEAVIARLAELRQTER